MSEYEQQIKTKILRMIVLKIKIVETNIPQIKNRSVSGRIESGLTSADTGKTESDNVLSESELLLSDIESEARKA